MGAAPSLPELQRGFAAAVLGDTAGPLAEWVLGNGLRPEARLRVYRNLVRSGHVEALRTAYPAVCKLVGEAFFEAAATRYLSEVPSSGGNLQDYGESFSPFLARLRQAADVAYLPDVARLEWARQEAYLAADAEPLDGPALASVAEDERPALRLALHPSVRLVCSAYPIFDIWLFCQEESPDSLRLDGSGQQVLVRRAGRQVEMQAIEAGFAAFVEALLANAPLDAACERATTCDAGFDPAACLRGLFEMRVVTGFSAPSREIKHATDSG
ncbi:MAG: DNA-binding domain-containing protein [Gammaproteobacteria bacterium]